MNAEIISIGTEIMVGSILNTNTKYLSNKLIELGIETHYHTSVDDNEERLVNVLNIALDRSDIIITTGGLGPTDDDMSKEVVSKVLGLGLEIDPHMLIKLENMFSKMNRHMTDNNKKQAVKPIGSQFITNDNGTAPGIFINKDNRKIIMLPGPPKEMIPMFENYVQGLIKEDYTIIVKSINTIGIGESALEVELKSLDIYEKNYDIATYAKEGTCEIKVIGKGICETEVEEKVNTKVNIIKSKIGDYIYGYDNVPLEQLLIKNLEEKKLTLALCESCTGGLISSKITSVSGASAIFDRGIITYSNKSKVDELNVEPNTLNKYGAVSEEVAFEMAKGLMHKTQADIVLSVTGLAGPDGGSIEKPIGLVYMCIMNRSNYKIVKHMISGNRTTIQERAASRALAEILKFI